jgi:two-component system, LytTR family, sensor kinase
VQMKVDRNKIILYLCMGIAFTLFWSLGNSHKYPGQFWAILVNSTWRIIYAAVLNFIFFEVTIPFVFRKRHYIIYNIPLAILLLFVHAMFWSYGMYAWRSLGIVLGLYTPLGETTSLENVLAAQMAFSMGSVFLFGVIRHIYNYQKLKQAAQLLQIQKQAAELNYLKSQTNPHFLFNTLNNIYSLARDKSDLAPESILRLSKILRFMLYETSGAYISIEQELKIISDYIELEKLRYDETLHINFNHDIEDIRQAVPPLLLIPLVENSFKHGVSETRSQPFVDIHLSIRNRQLRFVIKNSTDGSVGEQVPKENIGLSNLRRQLELLYRDFELFARQEQNVFVASLKINLASHV